jgi:HSP20 family protein
VAGVEKENIEIEINRKAIKLSGSRAEMVCPENGTYRLAEIQYGCFERMLILPTPIDTEKVSASYANGFLHIRLIKLPYDVTHKIPITDG